MIYSDLIIPLTSTPVISPFVTMGSGASYVAVYELTSRIGDPRSISPAANFVSYSFLRSSNVTSLVGSALIS